MQTNKKDFINLCLENSVLKFGDFTLKSGRQSHFFFNAGLFYNNASLLKLADHYAQLIYDNIIQHNIHFDCLYGPAYKGIMLAVATALSLKNNYNFTTDVAFNRKEVKNHGEGGNIVGADISNKKVLLIDDVISAGTATRESIAILNEYNTTIVAIIVALDRQEHAHNPQYKTAAEEITAHFNLAINSIVDLSDIIEFTQHEPEYNHYAKLLANNYSV